MTGRPPFPPLFARRIRRERERHGWSMRQLGVRCGLSTNGIAKIEGGRDFTVSSAIAITGALGIPLAALFADPSCPACDGIVPAGFTCNECGGRDEPG